MSQKWLILLGLLFGAILLAQTSNQNNFGGGSTLPTNLTFVVPTLTVSAATFGNGVLALAGNTSGTATITAPAVAGTNTNPVVFSNDFTVPNGTSTTPAMASAANLANGFGFNANLPAILATNVQRVLWGQNNQNMTSDYILSWTNSATVTGAGQDTGASRSAAGVLALGNATAGDTSGKVKAAGYMSVGTTFTSNAGCSETTLAGGATAGKFNAGAVSCTLIVTMGNSATAPNGWACKANDLTTTADTMIQTATAPTTATFSGTVVSGDVINFSCIGY